MAKELFKGEIAQVGATYEGKIEDGILSVSVNQDLGVLIDKAAAAIPGDSPIELLVVNLLKQGIKTL